MKNWSWIDAAAQMEVRDLLIERGVPTCTGRFRTHMEVELVNDGPVTILLDSRRAF